MPKHSATLPLPLRERKPKLTADEKRKAKAEKRKAKREAIIEKRMETIEFRPRDDATKNSPNTYAVVIDGVHVLDAVYGDHRQNAKYKRRGMEEEMEYRCWNLMTICNLKLSNGREIPHPSAVGSMAGIEYLHSLLAEHPDRCTDLIACARKAEVEQNKQSKKKTKKKRKKKRNKVVKKKSKKRPNKVA